MKYQRCTPAGCKDIGIRKNYLIIAQLQIIVERDYGLKDIVHGFKDIDPCWLV